MIGVTLARLSKHRVTRIAWAPVPAARDLRDRRHRQPLPRRRHARRRHRRPLGLGRQLAGPRAPDRLGLQRRQGLMATPAQTPRPRRREPGVRRDAMRDRLIESRLTPNAISLTGLRAQRGGGRARLAGALRLGRDRLHRRLGVRHARRALLAHVGQGHAVRRLPGLDARPHRGGHRAHRGRLRLRQATATTFAAAAVVVAVLASLMVSYTRARAEALGVECKVGIASRAVRVVILSVGIAVRRPRDLAGAGRLRAGGAGHHHRPAADPARAQGAQPARATGLRL